MTRIDEDWRRECEAREWIKRYKAQRKERGAKEAAKWWEHIKSQIAAKRGQQAVDILVGDMNAQSSKNRQKP